MIRLPPRLGPSAFLSVLVALAMPATASASVFYEWTGLAKACEAVPLENDIAPLEVYGPAIAFTAGKSDRKDFAYFGPSGELQAVARSSADGEWVQCLVREVHEDSRRGRTLANGWAESAAAAFPRSDYVRIRGLTPHFANPGVVRCEGREYVLSVRGYFGPDYHARYDRDERILTAGNGAFRLFVVRERSERLEDPCRSGSAG